MNKKDAPSSQRVFPAAKPPCETDPGMFHLMPELHDQEQLLHQVEMKCSDIIARHCYCVYHTDYPMRFGESHRFMSFSKYKVGQVTTQAQLHQGYIDSSIMRIIHEIHGLVTPYSPDILFQEERMSNIYQAFSPKEYQVLRNNLGLARVNNKHLDLEKVMKTIQWCKEATCPCHNHGVRRGCRNWQLRPATMVPREALLQLPAISDSIILQRRRAKNQDIDQASTIAQANSTYSTSSDTCIDLTYSPAEIAALDSEIDLINTDDFGGPTLCLTEAENQFNIKMKKL